MSKKNTGLLIALGAVIGAAAAGISYYLKYKSFNDELDKDFHDYEDEDAVEEVKEEPISCANAKRTYITLDSNKCKSCDEAEACEETAPAECPKTEEAAPAAATVEEDTEGAN